MEAHGWRKTVPIDRRIDCEWVRNELVDDRIVDHLQLELSASGQTLHRSITYEEHQGTHSQGVVFRVCISDNCVLLWILTLLK